MFANNAHYNSIFYLLSINNNKTSFEDETIKIWNLETFESIIVIGDHSDIIWYIDLTSDG